jgi:hypothetical protein
MGYLDQSLAAISATHERMAALRVAVRIYGAHVSQSRAAIRDSRLMLSRLSGFRTQPPVLSPPSSTWP